jgi:serine/threonine-protein kinase
MSRREPISDPDRDSRLAGLLEDLTDARRRGEPASPESAARGDPDLADELRALWAAAQLAEELARPDPMSDETAAWPSPVTPAPVPPSCERIGRCELIEELGRGGMGIVYLARDTDLGRVVALKRLLLGASATSRDIARFRGEAESAARLDHPNIVPIHAVDSDASGPYFLMRYVEGTTLARRLSAGPLPPREAVLLLSPVARAIGYAHSRGVLHRDLKPSNILIDTEGRPYVVDFGLAKRLDTAENLTGSDAVLGTPSYIPPEQASPSRGPVGPASDVYGLGAVLYHALTGRPPFQAASASDTLLQALEVDPVPPRALNPGVDNDLEMITLKCLQKRPELRYPSADALADDLDAYLAGEPVSARSASLKALTDRLMGETHHASVLEDWGLLWIYHSIALVVFFALAGWLQWSGVASRWPYVLLFTVGLGAWAACFWELRRRMGPIRFVERQIAHVWAAGMVGINLILIVEALLALPVLTLAPLLAVHAGMLFLVKGGILSGAFYLYALAEFLAVFAMIAFPRLALPIYGLVSAACFFATGWRYHSRRRASGLVQAPIRGPARPHTGP